MKKLLKADEIKLFAISDNVAFDKEVYEQLILAVSRSAAWAAEESATLTVSHSSTEGGTYVEFKEFTLAPGVDESLQFQVNLVGTEQFIKIVSQQNGASAILLEGVAVLADSRDVDTADVEEQPVPAVIHDTLDV